MNPTITRPNPDEAPSTRAAMRRNGWHTTENLGRMTGSCLESIRKTLEELAWKNRVIQVRVPGGGRGLMWHRTTPDTKQIAARGEPVSVADLPWRLKQTFLEKFEEMRVDGMATGKISKWARAEMSLEQELAGMKLVNQRRRPGDGFMYPCAWTVQAPWMRRPSSDNAYPFQVHFTGHLDERVMGPRFESFFEFDRPALRSSQREIALDCKMREQGQSVELAMYRIAHVRVDARTLRPIRCPTREELVEQTRKRLREAANNWRALRPFIPLPGKFSLIGSAEANRAERPAG